MSETVVTPPQAKNETAPSLITPESIAEGGFTGRLAETAIRLGLGKNPLLDGIQKRLQNVALKEAYSREDGAQRYQTPRFSDGAEMRVITTHESQAGEQISRAEEQSGAEIITTPERNEAAETFSNLVDGSLQDNEDSVKVFSVDGTARLRMRLPFEDGSALAVSVEKSRGPSLDKSGREIFVQEIDLNGEGQKFHRYYTGKNESDETYEVRRFDRLKRGDQLGVNLTYAVGAGQEAQSAGGRFDQLVGPREVEALQKLLKSVEVYEIN